MFPMDVLPQWGLIRLALKKAARLETYRSDSSYN
jgi:hypothetical protein